MFLKNKKTVKVSRVSAFTDDDLANTFADMYGTRQWGAVMDMLVRFENELLSESMVPTTDPVQLLAQIKAVFRIRLAMLDSQAAGLELRRAAQEAKV